MREFANPDQIDVPAGEPFVVVLADNGPGGYVWQVVDLPSAVRLQSEAHRSPEGVAPGATGEKAFELEATEPGTFALRFERRRGWEPGADREHSIAVTAR